MQKIVVDPELAIQYARVKNISLEEANKRLEENMVKEALEVDLRQQYQVLINAFRKMSPQLQGVVLRESDTNFKIESLKNEVFNLKKELESVTQRLEFERDVYKKSMAVLNGIVTEDSKTLARIRALEDSVSTPLYKKVINKIKWMFKR